MVLPGLDLICHPFPALGLPTSAVPSWEKFRGEVIRAWIGVTTPLYTSSSTSISYRSVLISSGANSLEVAPSGRVTDFVKAQGGHTVITKVCCPNYQRSFLTPGPYRQQRYCSSQRDPIYPKMVL